MKKILLIIACAILCPMQSFGAAYAEDAAPVMRQATRKTTDAQKATKKAATKKHAAKKTHHTKSTAKKSTQRTHATTAGSKSTAAQTPTTSKAKKTHKAHAARTKATTAGTKATAANTTRSKASATAAASHTKKTNYSTNPTAKKAAAPKATPETPKVKRVYRKGGVTYRHFNHLNDTTAQNLGAITKPTTHSITLNKPSRGYQTANHITFTTPDGKKGQLVLDTHNITAKRAERKGFGESTHGKQSVEIFAGSDATGKGLALIGEYPLMNNNVKVAVDPSGHVTLSGAEKPIEFSIHQ